LFLGEEQFFRAFDIVLRIKRGKLFL